jgi:hypothetical protein
MLSVAKDRRSASIALASLREQVEAGDLSRDDVADQFGRGQQWLDYWLLMSNGVPEFWPKSAIADARADWQQALVGECAKRPELAKRIGYFLMFRGETGGPRRVLPRAEVALLFEIGRRNPLEHGNAGYEEVIILIGACGIYGRQDLVSGISLETAHEAYLELRDWYGKNIRPQMLQFCFDRERGEFYRVVDPSSVIGQPGGRVPYIPWDLRPFADWSGSAPQRVVEWLVDDMR